MKRVAVIGGGASGFAAAITIAEKANDFTVTIYEKLQKPLKKLLATGNGRCNLTNVELSPTDYFGDRDFAAASLTRFSPQENIAFFREMGLLCKTEAMGRVYPVSGQASSVREILCAEAQKRGVQVVNDCEITAIQPQNGGFLLNGEITCDIVLICAGGSAAPKHGTDGGAYKLLGALGHTIIPPAPALTALECADFPKSLKGVRQVCDVTLLQDRNPIYAITGEVQFTEYGLSGIPIMQLSRLVSTVPNAEFTVKLNCLSRIETPEITTFLQKTAAKNPQKTAETLARGLLPQALGNALLLRCGIRKDEPCASLTNSRFARFSEEITAFTVKVTGVRGFEFAQVTAGGADCREFDCETMQSKRIKNLYACGEALNVDGGCGGYNLQWAWSSGRAAGEAVVKEFSSDTLTGN
ncbi:MAG: aminoacetone oxidase family FAD-binding enzyme [Candidatus Fimenecus sp.]